MNDYDDRELRWLILFEDGQRQDASAKIMLAYFHDWQSWCSLFAASHTGDVAEMTIHAADKVTRCKVLRLADANSWATCDNPRGLSTRT